MNPFDVLIEDGVISECLGRLKSGKEADVYLVERGGVIVVAKIYKNRAHRSFKNNADYKEGRKTRSSRTRRAIQSGSKFGREASEEAWKNTEADALFQLHAGGVRVPEPIMFYEGVLLMHLVKDADGHSAPRLIDLKYDAPTAKAHYLDLRGQMVRMLCSDVIHGDLSAYNILAGEDGPTIIDFPQIIAAAHSTRAADFFQRDFENVLNFLTRAEPALAAHHDDGRQIWRAYLRRELTPDFVPSPPKLNSGGRNRGGRGGDRNRGGRGGDRKRSDSGQGRAQAGPANKPSGARPARKPSRPEQAGQQPSGGTSEQRRRKPKSSSAGRSAKGAPQRAQPSTVAPSEEPAKGTSDPASPPARRRRRRRRRRSPGSSSGRSDDKS